MDRVTISQWHVSDRWIILQWQLTQGFEQKANFTVEILNFQAQDHVECDQGLLFHHIYWDSSRWDNPFEMTSIAAHIHTAIQQQ